jgi:hypothetical protein
LAARRPHLELYIRCMQEIRRFKPSTVSRRFSVAAGFCKTCVIDGLLEHSPAEHVRRPMVPAESPTLGFTHLQFEALLTAGRESLGICRRGLTTIRPGMIISSTCPTKVGGALVDINRQAHKLIVRLRVSVDRADVHLEHAGPDLDAGQRAVVVEHHRDGRHPSAYTAIKDARASGALPEDGIPDRDRDILNAAAPVAGRMPDLPISATGTSWSWSHGITAANSGATSTAASERPRT